MNLNLDKVLIEQRVQEESKQLASEEERIEEYIKLFSELCTMDAEKGMEATRKLHNFKQNEPSRWYVPLYFEDGTQISIQASAKHKCDPPVTLEKAEDYESFEVKTNFYVEGWGLVSKDKIYSYVPKDEVKTLIVKKLLETNLLR